MIRRLTLTVEVDTPTEADAFSLVDERLRAVECSRLEFADCEEVDLEPSEAKLTDMAWRDR